MKKGCLTGIVIFFALSILFAMCSSDAENADTNISSKATTEATVSTVFTTNTVTPHDHSFDEPTCIAPRTCSICGITDGEKLEHKWIDATCTTLKTCLDCGQTTGRLAQHQYSNGKCKVCNESDPSDPRNITVWIPTNGGKKYHSQPNCSNMKNPQQTTQDKAQAAGFEACSRCH